MYLFYMEQAKTSDCFNDLYRSAVIFNMVFYCSLGVLAVCVSHSLCWAILGL